MINCPYCERENPDGVRFCEKCRADLRHLRRPGTGVAPESSASPEPLLPPPTDPVSLPGTEKLSQIPLVERLEAPGPPPRPATESVVPGGGGNVRVLPQGGPQDPTWRSGVPGATGAPESTPASAAGSRLKLVVLRGLRVNATYPLYEGANYIGRPDDRPVDINLEDQEPADRIWTSRQHAVVKLENGALSVEDLNSLNGTFVNRARVQPGQQRVLQVNDIIQVGTVQLKVTVQG